MWEWLQIQGYCKQIDSPGFRVLIEDLQATIDAQKDNREPSPRAHRYTKYNNWNEVRGKKQHVIILYLDVLGHTNTVCQEALRFPGYMVRVRQGKLVKVRVRFKVMDRKGNV